MYAEIDKLGTLILQIENRTEEYAIGKWREEALVPIVDLKTNESGHYKESKIRIDKVLEI
jgi:hypothetical protein